MGTTLLLSVAALMFASPPAAASSPERMVGVDDFDFSSWDATYEVGIDDEGRATLHVEETRVAEFPESDQNRGIVAGYPDSYQGAGLDTTIISVRDESGEDVPYEIEEDDGLVYVLTGDDEYVHGSTTYVIEYEMRDVILAATETEVDEFYWDLLPLTSTQDVDAFRAEIVFDDTLATHLTGDASCYRGRQGSTDTCELSAAQAAFTVEARDLTAGEGITVAIALDAGTVSQPPARLPNAATDVLPYFVGAGAVLAGVGAWLAKGAMARSRRKGTGIVVAQYDVPDAMPPLLAGQIIPRAKNAVSAQIIHLAVRGMLRLEELPEAGEKAKGRRPRLRRLDARAPDPLDQRSLTALFGDSKGRSEMRMPRNSKSFAARIAQLLTTAADEAQHRGLTERRRSIAAVIIQTVALVAFAVMLALLMWSLVTGRASAGVLFFVTVMCAVLLIVTSIVAFSKHTVLTREGALQLEYLEGVREFIRVAEADRLRMLQSYSGAERRDDSGVEVIHVYERLLPYAILFGQENEWGEVLESAYGREQFTPTWYDGTTYAIAARVVYFSSATRVASHYSAPASSSGAGGSSGGGFSGGGGGGGFSGGR